MSKNESPYFRLYELLAGKFSPEADIQVSDIEAVLFSSSEELFGSGADVGSIINDMVTVGLFQKSEENIKLTPNKTLKAYLKEPKKEGYQSYEEWFDGKVNPSVLVNGKLSIRDFGAIVRRETLRGSMGDNITLKQDLQDWTDADWAAFKLACHLGVMRDGDFQVKAKHVFASENIFGNFFYDMLAGLVRLGVLEHHPDEFQYRWNKDSKGSWEK
jgi:hypothetical protein